MKIEEVAYAIAGETLAVLEQKYHYRIPDEHKRDVQRTVQGNLNEILAKVQQPEPDEGAAEDAGEEEQGQE